MNEELQSLVERAMAAGRSREQILTVLKDNGLDDAGVLSVDSYIKKKSPSALEESASQSDLRPSVSESLSSERVQLGFNEAAIKQQKKAIADAAAAQVYTAVAKTGGDLNKIQDKQAFANAYTTYRSLSDDPRAAALPQNPVTQTGEVDYAVVPTLKKGAIDYVNELIKQEQQRKADLGSKFTIPVLSEVAAGAESIVGGLLKFNEMITGQDSELASFFLDDAAQRSRDALIDYGLTEEQISKGFLGNIGEGNVGAGLAIFGSTLVQQVPQLAAVAATGGAAGLGLLGASAAGSGYAELQNRSDLSEGEKMLYGIGVGAAEYLAEKLFLGDVNMLRKAFSKEAIEGMTKKELGDMLFGAVPKGVRSVMEEGTEEVLTSVAQQTLAKVIAGEEFNPIEIAESAIYGGAAGGGVYLLSRGAGAIVDPENEAKIRGLRNGLKKTQEAAQDPELTDQEKEVLGRRAKEYTDGIEQLKRRDDEKVARMTPEDQTQLKSFQDELKAKVGQLRQVKSDEAAEQLKSEVRGLLDNIKQLSDKYDRQEEAGIPSPVVEGEAPVEAQPIEGAGQEAPEAGGVLQVPIEEGAEEVVAIQEAPITEEAPIVEEVPTAEPEAISDVKLTAEEVLFPSGQGDALGALFSDIVGVVYDTGLTKKGSDARLNWIRKYVDPTITEANARKEGFDFVGELLNDRIEKGLLNISKDKYGAFANAVKRLGLDIDAIAKEVSQTDFKEYYDILLADKRKIQAPTAEAAPVEQPVQEVAPAEEVVATEEVSDEENQLLSEIELNESKIVDLREFEIPTEKSNYEEEVKRIKEEIAKVRASKAPADEKRDLIDDLKAQIEDAKDSYENVVETYKDEIKALKDDIKKAQKRIDKIREKKTPAAPPVEAPVQEAPSAVSTNANGDALIPRQDFQDFYPELFSFLNTGEIYRRERGASTSRNEYLRNNQKTTDQILRSQYLGIFDAKDILVMMSSYTPRTKADIDRFNKAYLQAEQLFAVMQKAQKNDVIYKTKAQVIAVINRQPSLSQKQKDVLTSVVNSVKADKLFNINFRGEKNSYNFTTNLLKANNGSAFIHEIGHWGYFNLLNPQDRIDYMNYMSEKFSNRELTGLVFPAKIGAGMTGGVNAKDNYQEYFATQFDQWYTNQVGAEGILLKLYNTFKSIVDNLIKLFKEKGYNPDLVRYFDKIADVTKYDGNAKQDTAINQQLVDDLNTGDDEFGNPGIISESISEPEKTEDLDIKQEDWKDRAKKSWRSFWWSDEQRKIRTYKESLNSQLSREAKKFTEFATALNDLLRKSDKATADLVGKVMDGSISEEQIATLRDKKDGQLLFDLSNAMREYIDSLSEDIIFSPAFTKLSPDLQNTILDNLGTYLRGTYRFWKDKRFFPGEATIKAAIEEVYNELYSKEFDSLVSMFDVVETRDEISNLEKAYETAREKLIEEERQLPAGEKTTEVKNLIAQLELIGSELNEKRKLFKLQKELMDILIGTSEITDENVAMFLAQKDDYVDKQIEEAAPRLKAEAKDYVKAYLEEAKKIRESDKYKGLGMVSPSSIKVPDKQFKQKLNLPETFRNLLGEEKDPVVRFLDTAESLSNIKYKGDMILKIATQFKGTEFVKTEATKAEIASGEYRQVNDKFSPLNGKYVHKDVFDAITDRRLYDSEMAWFQTYLNILLLGRKSKVIYNIPTWRKNLTGGWWTMMANGVINPEFIQDLNRRGKLLRDKRADPETEAFLDIMAEFGLLGQGVNANLIGGVNAMYERAAIGSDMDYLNSMQKLGERIKGFDQWLGDKYSSVDDYTKLVVFRKEVKSFAIKLFGKSYDQLTEGEKKYVHEEAAERVKQSTPTFSRLPPIYYRIAQLPLGDFLSFEFEAFRSFTANFANGYLDIQTAMKGKDKDGNSLSSEQKAEYMKEGVARLMGTAAVFGMRFSIPAILAGMALGDDDELEEDIKALRPNWMEGHSIIPTGITKDGIATTYDYSMEDPYGTIVDVVTDPLSFPGHMIDMLNPNMAVTFLFNLYDSKDIYGKEIVNSYDSPFTKAYKYGGYTLKSLILPPFATSAVRDELRRQELEADRYSPLDAVGRVTSRAFIRDYTFDTGTQLYYFGQQFATKQEQYTDLSGIARRNRLAELEEVRKMYKAIINIGIKKGNTKMIVDANKNIKRQFKPAEEVYILTGYEIPEQK
jgi:hypothetical protein